MKGEEAQQTLYELIDPSLLKDGTLEPNRGLLALPEPRPGDLFFDIEGDPYALDDGIDYLRRHGRRGWSATSLAGRSPRRALLEGIMVGERD